MLPLLPLINPPAFAASSTRLLKPLTFAKSMSPPLLLASRLLFSVAVSPLAMPPPPLTAEFPAIVTLVSASVA